MNDAKWWRPSGCGGSIARWAVMFVVWIAGSELDLRKAWSIVARAASRRPLAVGTPLLLGD
jgi:hypothetical protein